MLAKSFRSTGQNLLIRGLDSTKGFSISNPVYATYTIAAIVHDFDFCMLLSIQHKRLLDYLLCGHIFRKESSCSEQCPGSSWRKSSLWTSY